MRIKPKLTKLISAISMQNVDTSLEVNALAELICSAVNYTQSVVELEAALLTSKYQIEGNEYRENIQRLDQDRTKAHNSLIANLRMVNRLAERYKIEQVYTGSDERIEIGDFAGELC